MIITRLHGRLGNQMFQYAAACGLAARLGVPVALDERGALRRGEGVLTRVFDLPLVPPDALPPDRTERPVPYAFWRLFGRSPRFRRERGLGYNPAFETWGDDSYLHGYWQSERYFNQIAEQIRRAFTFPAAFSTQNAEMAARIGEGLAISLHVRRGDYLTFNAHTVCDETYYAKALERLLDGLSGTPTVFVFSDDPDWAKENLPLPVEKVVVDFNGPEADFEDMRLMSLCRHNIIGNSSFSWWAAWLNAHDDKRVAGPVQWFGDPKLNNPDILPPDWLRITS
ncbi:alpha-1,2-fucosyltransferase [Antarcticimicrobium sediminis]|uniref:Alpha-1,2-fucosyltransferase n=1 Tax=Antarcticimicrobium sediminis TaxID=2546227 RepID=A0A4R5ENI6_9RHOB|nr:alpha-1,2-fucosyltransferase [Antarcticimicrobium sediminis]TDE36013.1 alpha-1,2-fucosyltransferase [Antarcticimicrobium sediminis]